MPNFSISGHTLAYNTNFSYLQVRDTDAELVGNYDLSSPYEIKCVSGDYVITSVGSVPAGNLRYFNSGEDDEMRIDGTGHLGVTDLRTECKIVTHTYHLDVCPIVVHFANDKLKVQAPCPSMGSCAAPDTACCTTTEDPYCCD